MTSAARTKPMNKRQANESYDVGYKRPPRDSRFQKGTSGNPFGRRKRSSNYLAALATVLSETVRINENGVPRRVTKHQAIWIRVTNAAVSGNKKARTILARYHETSANRAESGPRIRVTFSDRARAELGK